MILSQAGVGRDLGRVLGANWDAVRIRKLPRQAEPDWLVCGWTILAQRDERRPAVEVRLVTVPLLPKLVVWAEPTVVVVVDEQVATII